MEITSTAFKNEGRIPSQYAMPAAGGRNISLPLEWSNPPEGTKSFALSIVDPHPVAENWVHWLVINLPADTKKLEEGASGIRMPPGALELKNSYGKVGYGGPQPPKGTGDHPYVITLYALDAAHLDLPQNTDLKAFLKGIEGKVIAKATITGYYSQ